MADPKFRKVFHLLYKQEQDSEAKVEKSSTSSNDKQGRQTNEVVKLPSDSMIYSPALKQVVQGEQIIDHISDFAEVMRMESEQSKHRRNSPNFEQAREKARKTLVEAEKYRVKITCPEGNDKSQTQPEIFPVANVNMNNDKERLSDDNFFHLTCHIDNSLVSKIEAGDYVDLEKLLPKEKVFRKSGDTRLEWVFREGSTFLIPCNDRDKKINSVHRWEQAFRVYVTIYCGANLHRSKEIWQYISVINTAAASYQSENVASYNYTFRHLMEFNLVHSWGITYNQMWNLCMKDPISKTGNCAINFGQANYSSKNCHQVAGSSSSSISGSGSYSSSNSSSNNSNISGTQWLR